MIEVPPLAKMATETDKKLDTEGAVPFMITGVHPDPGSGRGVPLKGAAPGVPDPCPDPSAESLLSDLNSPCSSTTFGDHLISSPSGYTVDTVDSGYTVDSTKGLVPTRSKDTGIDRANMVTESDQDGPTKDCGIYTCRPDCIQPWANIKLFIFTMCMLSMLSGTLVAGYVNSVITTIEKRFEFGSTVSGLIAASVELGTLVSVIFVSYLGGCRHIPKWIGEYLWSCTQPSSCHHHICNAPEP